jgi:hypothetical protein
MREEEGHAKPEVGEPVAPEWWPAGKRPERLKVGWLYPAKDGTWRWADGRIANRKERRNAGIK